LAIKEKTYLLKRKPMSVTQMQSTTLKKNDSIQNKFIESLPFYLSIYVNELEDSRYFYREIIGVREVRVSEVSVHFDFYGSQLILHKIPELNAKNTRRDINAENVPGPHFGVVLAFEEWGEFVVRLTMHSIHFLSEPNLKFIGEEHEQFSMVIEDPSGYGIEIKSFTKITARTRT
jgi:uncharacterized protein